jgi:hypothetical protein
MFELMAVKIAVLRSKSKDFWRFFFAQALPWEMISKNKPKPE